MSDVAVVDRKSESREAGGGDKRSSPPFPVSPSPFSITEIHNIAVECATYLLYSSFLLLSSPVFFLFLFLRFFFLYLLLWRDESNYHGRKNDAIRFDSRWWIKDWSKGIFHIFDSIEIDRMKGIDNFFFLRLKHRGNNVERIFWHEMDVLFRILLVRRGTVSRASLEKRRGNILIRYEWFPIDLWPSFNLKGLYFVEKGKKKDIYIYIYNGIIQSVVDTRLQRNCRPSVTSWPRWKERGKENGTFVVRYYICFSPNVSWIMQRHHRPLCVCIYIYKPLRRDVSLHGK